MPNDANDAMNEPAPRLVALTAEESHAICRKTAFDVRRLLDHLRQEVDAHAGGAAVRRDPGPMVPEILKVRSDLIGTLGSITGLGREAIEKCLGMSA